MLSLRSLAWIGLVSYAFYLWHYYVMIALRSRHLHGLTQHCAFFVLSFVSAITLAAGSYYLIERPALRFKQGRRFNRLAIAGAAVGAFALLSTVAIAAHGSPRSLRVRSRDLQRQSPSTTQPATCKARKYAGESFTLARGVIRSSDGSRLQIVPGSVERRPFEMCRKYSAGKSGSRAGRRA